MSVKTLLSDMGASLSSGGGPLVFGAVALLAAGAAIAEDWRWSGEIGSFPGVVGDDYRTYRYRRVNGGGFVEIYRPSGAVALHRITPSASRDDRQLAHEVVSLVNDLYSSRE